MNNNESISKTNQIHTTESIGWFNSLSILINGTGLKRWIDSFRYSYSSAFEISYLWSSDIEKYSILSKCRNVEERLILLITTTIKNQTHPIWFNDNYQIDKSMVCDSLINNRAYDWLMADWLNGESNLISIPSQSDSIHSSSLLLLSSSPPFFYAVIYSYSIRQNQYPISISMIVLYYLSIEQWIHKCE